MSAPPDARLRVGPGERAARSTRVCGLISMPMCRGTLYEIRYSFPELKVSIGACCCAVLLFGSAACAPVGDVSDCTTDNGRGSRNRESLSSSFSVYIGLDKIQCATKSAISSVSSSFNTCNSGPAEALKPRWRGFWNGRLEPSPDCSSAM